MKASVGTDSEMAREDRMLLGSFSTVHNKEARGNQNLRAIVGSNVEAAEKQRTKQDKAEEEDQSSDKDVIQEGLKDLKYKSYGDKTSDIKEKTRSKKHRKDLPSSSKESDKPRRAKKKQKKRRPEEKKSPASSSSPSSSDNSDMSSSESDNTSESEDDEDAELCYEVTDFKSANLPDLPEKWDRGFKKLRSYVPLTLFETSLLENYYDDEKEQKLKDKSDVSKITLKNLEKQLTYGDFIEMSDLEEH